MGRLIAAGGIIVMAEQVHSLEKNIHDLCNAFGFPNGEIFKWSPGRETWMRDNLVQEKRTDFFLKALELAKQAGAKAFLVASDESCDPAILASTHAQCVVRLLIERLNLFAKKSQGELMIIADRPGGDRKTEEDFLLDCLETLQNGTKFVKPDNIILNVVSSPTKFIRLLQLADLVTSCSVAFVSGENVYSGKVFPRIKELFASDGRIGGVGVKLHPDYKYVNLYHWLLGDTHYRRGNAGLPLPSLEHPYSQAADKYELSLFRSPKS